VLRGRVVRATFQGKMIAISEAAWQALEPAARVELLTERLGWSN
jgi:hypothetical protein